MNKIHRTVWNEVTRSFVAVAEVVRGRGKRSGSTQAATPAEMEPVSQPPRRGIARSALRPLALEQRFMFDGAALATALDAAHAQPDAADHAPEATVAAQAAAAARAQAERPADVAAAAPAAPAGRVIVFIDDRIADRTTLADAVVPGAEVVMVDHTRSGIEQMSAALANGGEVQAVHVVSHGSSGQFILGSDVVDAAAVDRFASALRGMGTHLSAHADLLLYGCSTGQGPQGQALIEKIAQLTGADVAASVDANGNDNPTGWSLEASTGSIEARLPFDAARLQQWEGSLDSRMINLQTSAVASATDGQNNTYLMGGLKASTFDFGGTSLTFGESAGVWVAKYDYTGALAWVRQWNSLKAYNTYGDYGRGLAVDSQGNVYVSMSVMGSGAGGTSNNGYNTLDVDPGAGVTSITTTSFNSAAVLVKLDSSGLFQWERHTGVSGDGGRVTVDASDNVYYVANFRDSASIGGVTLTSGGTGTHHSVIKFNSAGAVQWTKTAYAGNDVNGLNDISVNAAGEVFLAGYNGSSLTIDGVNYTTNWYSSEYDGLLWKLNADGTTAYVRKISGSANERYLDQVPLSDGSVIVSGAYSAGTDLDPTAATVTPSNAGGADYFVAKLNSSGAVVWSLTGGGSAGDSAKRMFVDSDGSILVTGTFNGTATIGGQSFTSAGNNDAFVMKVNTSGQVQWVKTIGGAYLDDIIEIAPLSGGKYKVTAVIRGTVDVDPGPGVLNASSASSTLAGVAVVTWDSDGALASTPAPSGSNAVPTLTTVGPVTGGAEDTVKAITFAGLQALANEADSDGSVTGFVVKAVSSGTLRIGNSDVSATPWNASTNATIDATHQAYWTPAGNANGTLDAFTVVALDDQAAQSASPVSVKVVVAAVNDAPVNAAVPVVTGTHRVGQQLTAGSGTWSDADGDSLSYSYQWYRSSDAAGSGEVAIAGATALNYALTASDAHKFVRVVVTAKDSHGSSDQTAASVRTEVDVALTNPENAVEMTGTTNVTLTNGTVDLLHFAPDFYNGGGYWQPSNLSISGVPVISGFNANEDFIDLRSLDYYALAGATFDTDFADSQNAPVVGSDYYYTTYTNWGSLYNKQFSISGNTLGANGATKGFLVGYTDQNNWMPVYAFFKDITGTLTINNFLLPTLTPSNTAPVFDGSTTSLSVESNSSAVSVKSLLGVRDSDASQTLTWTQSSAPGHGTLSFSGATASSGAGTLSPGGTITYTPAAGYVGADTFTVQVSDGTATVTRTISVNVIDSIAPSIASITRQTANSNGVTSADTLTWRVAFSEQVGGVDGSDFTLSGATGVSLSVSAVDGKTYDVTASGGNLSSYSGSVSLAFAGTQNIKDGANNALVATTPTGINQSSYTLDNTAPAISSVARQTANTDGITNADQLTYRVTFSEAVDASSVTAGAFSLNGTTAAVTSVVAAGGNAYDVTVSGGDLAGLDGDVTLVFSSSIKDLSGNALDTAFSGDGKVYHVDNTVGMPSGLALASAADDTGTFDHDGVTANTKPTIKGVADAYSTVTLNIDGTDVGTTSADALGVWSFTLSSTLVPGVHTAKAKAADTAGNTSSYSAAYSFTLDTAAPVLIAATPADNDDAVAGGANIVLSFDESVFAGSGSIVITNPDDPVDTRTISIADASQVTIAGSTVTINPAADLKGATHYHVRIDATALVDAAGNAYLGISSATELDFTTVNTKPVSSDDRVTLTGSSPLLLGLGDFGNFSDAEGAALAGVKIVNLPQPVSAGSLQYDDGGTWTAVKAGQEISAADIAAGKLRYVPTAGGGMSTLQFQVSDGTDYSTAVYTLTAGPGNAASINSAVKTSQVFQVSTESGLSISGLTASGVPTGLPKGFSMPLGQVGFTVGGLAHAGDTAQISVAVDDTSKMTTFYKKNLVTNKWEAVPGQVVTKANGQTVFSFSLTDGGVYDADRTANGVIVDPGLLVADLSAPLVAENTTYVTNLLQALDLSSLHGQVSFALAGTGPDDARFTLDAATGVLRFAQAPDYEAPTDGGDGAGNNTYVVRVTATGSAGGSVVQELVVTVVNDNGAQTGGPQLVQGDDTEVQSGQSYYLDADPDGDGTGYTFFDDEFASFSNGFVLVQQIEGSRDGNFAFDEYGSDALGILVGMDLASADRFIAAGETVFYCGRAIGTVDGILDGQDGRDLRINLYDHEIDPATGEAVDPLQPIRGYHLSQTGVLGLLQYTLPTVVDGEHAFSVTLNDGTKNYEAVVAGVHGTDVAAPVISGISQDSGSSDQDGITRNTTLALHGTALANSSVTLYLDGVAMGSTTSDAAGQWAWDYNGTALAQGSYLFTARVEDASISTVSRASHAYSVTVDTSSPTTTVASATLSADTGADNTDFITSTSAQTISGTLSTALAEGEKVYVSLDDGDHWTEATANEGQDTWTLAGVVLAGSGTLKVKVTDIAGNDGPVASQAYKLDTTLPTVTDAHVAIAGGTGTSGAYKIGDTVTATWNNGAAGDANADISGVTFDFSAFGGGTAVAATNSG
uniref:DUF4347 domain-containing protein n=1 Tax=Azohydromonas lata TaxID=45677 RepID=UPI000AA61847